MTPRNECDARLIDRIFEPEAEGVEIGSDVYSDTESFPETFYEGTIEAIDEEETYED